MYVGILDGKAGNWGVRLPDFPGCYGGGETPEAAVDDAAAALRDYVADMIDAEERIPAPRSLAGLQLKKGEAFVYVPLVVDNARPVTANISMDANVRDAIDEAAKRRGLTRSSFMVAAALEKAALYPVPGKPKRPTSRQTAGSTTRKKMKSR